MSDTGAIQTTPAQRRFAFAVLLLGVVCMGMGQTIIFAVLPPIARAMGLVDFEVLSIFMISAVLWVTMGPLWGRRSDIYGRRPMILIGLGGFTVSMALFATVIQLGAAGLLSGIAFYTLLIGTRMIYGLVGSAQPGAAQAYIADRTTPEQRTAGMAAFPAAFGLGAMAGPLFASVFSPLGDVAPLYAVALLSAIAGLGVLFFLPERTPPKDRPRPPKVSPADPRIRSFLIFGVATAIATAIPVQFIGFYMIDRAGAENPLQYASLALSISSAAALFAQLVIVQYFKLPPLILMRSGPALILVGHGIIALSTELGAISFGMLLSGLGGGLLAPGYIGGASLAVTHEEQGSVAGLSNAAIASGFVFAPVFGSFFYWLSPWALFAFTATIGAGAFVFVWVDKSIGSQANVQK